MVLRLLGNDRGAVSAHQQALTLAQEIGETALEVEALGQLGLDAEQQGRTADAAACFEKALSQGRGSGEETETAVRLNHLGRIQWLQGDLAGAQETLQRALAAIREVDQLDPYHTAQIQANLGNVFYEQEDFDAAEAMWQAALRAFHVLNVVYDKCGLLNNLGGLALKRDDLDMAQAYFEESCSIANDLGNQRGMVDALTNLGTLMRRRQDWPAAADYVRQALGCHPGLYYQIGLWQDLARSYLLIALGLLKQANQDQISWSSAMKQAVPEIFLAGIYLVRSFWIKLVHSVRQPFSK
jgi:tetratricopeptide (TPR) repeat protein